MNDTNVEAVKVVKLLNKFLILGLASDWQDLLRPWRGILLCAALVTPRCRCSVSKSDSSSLSNSLLSFSESICVVTWHSRPSFSLFKGLPISDYVWALFIICLRKKSACQRLKARLKIWKWVLLQAYLPPSINLSPEQYPFCGNSLAVVSAKIMQLSLTMSWCC